MNLAAQVADLQARVRQLEASVRMVRLEHGTSKGFTGRVIFDGGGPILTLEADGKRYVRTHIRNITASYDDGPIPNPTPVDEIWWDTVTHAGDIHVPFSA